MSPKVGVPLPVSAKRPQQSLIPTSRCWPVYPKKEHHGLQVGSSLQFSLVQSLSCVQPFVTPWIVAHQAPLSFTISPSLLKFMSIELVTLSYHLILGCPLLLLPSIFLNIRAFSSESALHIRWPKYYSFSFSISPSNEDLGLISFRIDW